MKIIVDAMGGDHAPQEIVKGALNAAKARPDLEIVLVGREEAVRAAAGCGVVLLATVHAASVAELSTRPLLRGVLESGVFRRAVVISGADRRCRVEELP